MSRKAKVLEISSYPPPRAGWGIRVSFVMEALREAGHACEVINIAPESRRIPSPEYLTSMNGLDYTWKCLWWSLKGYRIHMHLNGNSPKGFVLAVIAHIAGLVTFKRPDLTMHAGPYQIYFPKERSPKLVPVLKLIFGSARRIICNSEAVKAKIVEYGIHPDKIFPIQAFSRQYLRFHPKASSPALQKFRDEHPQLICSYVFFRPEFFVDDMIRAIARLRETHPGVGLMILGSDQGSEDTKDLAAELGIGDHVYFAGDLDHDDFLTHISISALKLRTPIRDGIASSVLEALALGVPVVASENERRPASTITYNHEEVSDMVRALSETLDDLEGAKARIVKPEIRDTVAEEVAVLVGR